jgi:hypothetical protein
MRPPIAVPTDPGGSLSNIQYLLSLSLVTVVMVSDGLSREIG